MEKLLAYGAIGLGLALALLTYRLLSAEQARPGDARARMLTAIYVFMAFALLLAGGGFIREYQNSDAKSLSEVRKERDETKGQLGKLKSETQVEIDNLKAQSNKALSEAKQQLEGLQAQHRDIQERVKRSRELTTKLMDLKQGKIQRLKSLAPGAPGYFERLSEVQKDIEELDAELRKAMRE